MPERKAEKKGHPGISLGGKGNKGANNCRARETRYLHSRRGGKKEERRKLLNRKGNGKTLHSFLWKGREGHCHRGVLQLKEPIWSLTNRPGGKVLVFFGEKEKVLLLLRACESEVFLERGDKGKLAVRDAFAAT